MGSLDELRSAINPGQLSPFDHLPTELITRIFWFTENPIGISSVCRLWREIALSAPELWLAINPCNDNENLDLTKLHIARSQSHPLSVVLGMDDLDDDEDPAVIFHALDLLMPHVDRWWIVSLEASKRESMEYFLEHLRSITAPQVKRLRIMYKIPRDPLPILSLAPSFGPVLNYLAMHGVVPPFGKGAPTLPMLTQLDIQYVREDVIPDLIAALAGSPLLRHLSIGVIFPARRATPEPSLPTIILQHLQYFTLADFKRPDGILSLLTHIRAPNLERLQLVGDGACDHSEVLKLFGSGRASLPSTEELILDSTQPDALLRSDWVTLFKAFPNVSRLAIGDDDVILDRIMNALSSPQKGPDGVKVPPLRRLRELRYAGELSGRLCTFVKYRTPSGPDRPRSFTLYIHHDGLYDDELSFEEFSIVEKCRKTLGRAGKVLLEPLDEMLSVAASRISYRPSY